MTILDLTNCPYYLISRATLVVASALRRELERAGAGRVRPAYLGVLMTLWQEDRLKIIEISRRAGLEPSSLTGLLDRMERDGLVSRVADHSDRRAHRIELTPAGHEVQGAVVPVVRATIDRVFEGVAESDVAVLKGTLRRILENAGKMGDA